MTLSVGDSAPVIEAENQTGEAITITYKSPTVVYFYPRDDTPGCTTEACEFDAELETYQDAGVEVYGVSTDDVDSHAEFADKHGIGFDLLADPAHEIAESFGVEIVRDSAQRTTFVIVDGTVKAVYTGVKPDGHARDVLMDMLDEELVTLDW